MILIETLDVLYRVIRAHLTLMVGSFTSRKYRVVAVRPATPEEIERYERSSKLAHQASNLNQRE